MHAQQGGTGQVCRWPPLHNAPAAAAAATAATAAACFLCLWLQPYVRKPGHAANRSTCSSSRLL
jgi:hypothetical protein